MTLSPPSVASSSALSPPGPHQNTAAGQQRPTLTNIHIRSVDDAKKLFYAVQLGLLPKIERRLDAQERKMLRPGNVYVWEERGPTGGENGYQVCIERWTEGLSWSASRIRDDFLMYYENVKKKSDKDSDSGGVGSSSGRARSLENEVLREGERDLYVKQTYSVHRNDVPPEDTISGAGLGGKDDVKGGSQDGKKEKKKPRKWHLNAYFTKSTEGNLKTIDSIPFLRDLVVPEGIFSSARQTKKSSASSNPTSSVSLPSSLKLDPSSSVSSVGSGAEAYSDAGGGRKRGREGASVQRTYAPFPVGERGMRPALPPPPSAVSVNRVAPPVGQGLRGQPPPPPPPPPPPSQWHHAHQQQSQSMQQDGTSVFEQQADGVFGGYATGHFGAHTQQPQQHPQQQQQVASPVYSNAAFPSSPVSPYSSSASAFDFTGSFGYGGLQTQQQQQQQQAIHRQHTHTPLGHVHAQSFRSPHQQMSHQGPSFTTARHPHHPHHGHDGSPSGSDSPVLSEIGGGGSGGSGSGASTSWHTPSPRLNGLGVPSGVGGVSGAAGLGSMCVGGVGGNGEPEEDLSGYMPMPPLRYSPDADLDFPPSASSSNSSTMNNAMALAHAHDDLRTMSLGGHGHAHSTSGGINGLARLSPHANYSYSHAHPSINHNHNNDLTFVAMTLNPDFTSSSPGSLTPSLADHDPTYTPTAALNRRDRSRSTSSNSPFRRRPIQLPQLNVPATVDLSTGGAYEYVESDYVWNTGEDDEDGLSSGGVGTPNAANGNGSGGAGAHRVALAPLHSLQRNHPYRRNPLDDRQLRMLG